MFERFYLWRGEELVYEGNADPVMMPCPALTTDTPFLSAHFFTPPGDGPMMAIKHGLLVEGFGGSYATRMRQLTKMVLELDEFKEETQNMFSYSDWELTTLDDLVKKHLQQRNQ